MASSIVLLFVKGGGCRQILSSRRIKDLAYHLGRRNLQFASSNQTPVGTSPIGSCIVKGPTGTVTSVRHNTQHRVVLLPEVPSDNSSTNPILKRFDANPDENTAESSERLLNLPDFGKVTERDCYFGLGKALLEFESAVTQLEQKCEEGVKDFKTLFKHLELARCHFEGVWNSVNLLNLTTDHLDRDRIAILHARAEAAFASRHNSKVIHATLKQIKDDQLAKKGDLLDAQEQRILDRYLTEYRHQGFELPEKKKLELTNNWMKRLNEARRDYTWRMTTSTERFRHQIKDPNVVRDFPVDVLKAMASDSSQPTKGPWTVTLHPYIYKQVMAYSPERSLRWKVHQADVTRGTRSIDIYTQVISQVKDIRQHRLDQALTLGYKHFAEMSMDTKMAANVENVHTMIASLLGKAKQYQESELEQLQAYADSRGFDEDLEVFDVEFFKRKQRRTMLGMSDEDLRDFFPLPKVLTGIFRLCEALFDIRFEEITGLKHEGEELAKVLANKKWAPEIKLYRVIDVSQGGGNKVLGKFYLDPYVRDDKGYAGGDKGWYVPIRPHSTIAGCEALGAMVLSLPIPNYGKPSLLSVDETEEILRNFGNLLLHVCSTTGCKWADLSGKTGLEWDVLDVAGKFMTYWMYVPEVLRSLSGHWSTNEPLPNNVIETLCTLVGKQHMAGYSLCHELYRASYDLAFYTEDYDSESYQDIAERFHGQYLLLPPAKGDAFPLYLSEIMGGDYPAALYSNTWAKMLAADVFSAVQEAFESNSAQTPENRVDILNDESVKIVTRRFRKTLLGMGSSQASSEVFRLFRGRDPSHEALLLSLGLLKQASPKIKGQKQSIIS